MKAWKLIAPILIFSSLVLAQPCATFVDEDGISVTYEIPGSILEEAYLDSFGAFYVSRTFNYTTSELDSGTITGIPFTDLSMSPVSCTPCNDIVGVELKSTFPQAAVVTLNVALDFDDSVFTNINNDLTISCDPNEDLEFSFYNIVQNQEPVTTVDPTPLDSGFSYGVWPTVTDISIPEDEPVDAEYSRFLVFELNGGPTTDNLFVGFDIEIFTGLEKKTFSASGKTAKRFGYRDYYFVDLWDPTNYVGDSVPAETWRDITKLENLAVVDSTPATVTPVNIDIYEVDFVNFLSEPLYISFGLPQLFIGDEARVFINGVESDFVYSLENGNNCFFNTDTSEYECGIDLLKGEFPDVASIVQGEDLRVTVQIQNTELLGTFTRSDPFEIPVPVVFDPFSDQDILFTPMDFGSAGASCLRNNSTLASYAPRSDYLTFKDGVFTFICDSSQVLAKSSPDDSERREITWPDGTPLVGDFDGDGISDFALQFVFYRNWYGYFIFLSESGGITATIWGTSSDDIVVGDFDDDSCDDIAAIRNGNWFIKRLPGVSSNCNQDPARPGVIQARLGDRIGGADSSDYFLTGDVAGSYGDDAVVYRRSDSAYYICANNDFPRCDGAFGVPLGFGPDSTPVIADVFLDGFLYEELGHYEIRQPSENRYELHVTILEEIASVAAIKSPDTYQLDALIEAVPEPYRPEQIIVGDYDGDGALDFGYTMINTVDQSRWVFHEDLDGDNVTFRLDDGTSTIPQSRVPRRR